MLFATTPRERRYLSVLLLAALVVAIVIRLVRYRYSA